MLSRKFLDITDKYTESFLILFSNEVDIRKDSLIYSIKVRYLESFRII